jgi:hypothetical protein
MSDSPEQFSKHTRPEAGKKYAVPDRGILEYLPLEERTMLGDISIDVFFEPGESQSSFRWRFDPKRVPGNPSVYRIFSHRSGNVNLAYVPSPDDPNNQLVRWINIDEKSYTFSSDDENGIEHSNIRYDLDGKLKRLTLLIDRRKSGDTLIEQKVVIDFEAEEIDLQYSSNTMSLEDHGPNIMARQNKSKRSLGNSRLIQNEPIPLGNYNFQFSQDEEISELVTFDGQGQRIVVLFPTTLSPAEMQKMSDPADFSWVTHTWGPK